MNESSEFSRSIATACVVLAVAAFSIGAAMAGSKYSGGSHVTINKNADGSGSASAYLGAVYNSDGTIEYLGCQKSGKDRVFCHARTEADVRVSCSVISNYLAQSVASLVAGCPVDIHMGREGCLHGGRGTALLGVPGQARLEAVAMTLRDWTFPACTAAVGLVAGFILANGLRDDEAAPRAASVATAVPERLPGSGAAVQSLSPGRRPARRARGTGGP